MALYRAGEIVRYRITWLEMTERPSFGWPKLPLGADAMLLRADEPPAWYFRALYDAVGADHGWTDRHADSEEALSAWLSDPRVSLHSLVIAGWPQGFFVLDARARQDDEEVCEIAYLGLVPEARGRGLGSWLVQAAVLTGWNQPGVRKLTVNTCTLDNPRALVHYQRAGFVPVRSEERSRRLTTDLVLDHPLL